MSMDAGKAPTKTTPARNTRSQSGARGTSSSRGTSNTRGTARTGQARTARRPSATRDGSKISKDAKGNQKPGSVPQFNQAFGARPSAPAAPEKAPSAGAPSAPAAPDKAPSAGAPSAPAAPEKAPSAGAPSAPAAPDKAPSADAPSAPAGPSSPEAVAPATPGTAPIVPSRIANAPPVKQAAPGTTKGFGAAGGLLGLETVTNGAKNIWNGNYLQGAGQVLSGLGSTAAGLGSTIADKLGGAAKHLPGIGHVAAGIDGVNDLVNKSGFLDKTIGAAKVGSALPLVLSKAFGPLAPGLTGVATGLDGARDIYNQLSSKGLSGLTEAKGVGGILKTVGGTALAAGALGLAGVGATALAPALLLGGAAFAIGGYLVPRFFGS
jgi:hypothetical protein